MTLLRSVIIGAATVCAAAATDAPVDSTRLSAVFREPLAEALASMSMTPADMTFRTDHVDDDRFRLPIMDAAFADPLGAFDAVYAAAEELGTSASPHPLIERMTRALSLRDRSVLRRSDVTPYTVRADLTRRRRAIRQAVKGVASHELDSLRTWSLAQIGDDGGEQSGDIDIFAMRAAEHAERERNRWHIDLAARFDFARIMNEARYVAHLAHSVRRYAVGIDPDSLRSRLIGDPNYADSVTVVVGTLGDDVYTGDAELIIDPGGDDRYEFEPPTGPLDRPIQIVIDLAGDDAYRGSVGAGLFGTSIVIDAGGDDVYDGDDYTQGCGVFGVGLVWDEAGDDIYRAGSAAQGVGYFGIGAIVDAAGNDTYRIESYGQGLGGTSGLGLIDDRAGNDAYLSGGRQTDVLRYDDHYVTMSQGVGLGMRPVASGGVGMLVDRHGNDTYVADIFGQGAGYWFGIGALIDTHGHDRYNAYQYAQGSGVHLAAGYLVDRWGHDAYVSNGVSQGSGHDLSTGILYDETGDDSYVTEGLSLGAGNANGISLFVDMTGADGYLARRSDVLGYSDQRREYGMIGVALDLAGRDIYGAPWGADSTWWAHSTYGVGVDREWELGESPSREPDRGRGKSAEEVAAELVRDPDSLFVQASHPVAAYRYLIRPARDSLIARNSELRWLWASKLSSESARERHALIEIHQDLFRRADTTNVSFLIDSLSSSTPRARRMAAYLLGFVHLGDAPVISHVPPLIEMLDHSDWKTRRASALSLWRAGDESAEGALIAELSDTIALVRQAAALALANVGTPASNAPLAKTLSDTSQMVRYSGERALASHGNASAELAPVIASGPNLAVAHALRAVRSDSTGRDVCLTAVLAALGETRPWYVRAEAAGTLATWGATETLDSLDSVRAHAEHPYLIERLDAARDALRRMGGSFDAGTH